MKTCTVCNIEYKEKHFNQRCCSDNCRIKSKKDSKAKYKKSEKGLISEEKWINSDKRRENEKSYQQKPEAKKKAVIRSTRTLKNSPSLQEAKRKRDAEYSKSEIGRNINKVASKKYRKTDNGIMTARLGKYVRRVREGGGTIKRSEWIEKLKIVGNKCTYCSSTNSIELDHIVPLSKGGINSIQNAQPLCRSCNRKKSNRILSNNPNEAYKQIIGDTDENKL